MRNKATFVQKCSKCGFGYPPERMICRCASCGGRIDILYDYEKVKNSSSKRRILARGMSMWEYSDLLPILDRTKRVSFGEGGTSLVECKKLGSDLGLKKLFVKDESRNPTGSFKDRCSSVSVSKAVESSIEAMIIASSGNAGASACAYAVRAGVPCYVFVPTSVDPAKLAQIAVYGGRVVRVMGGLEECDSLARKASSKYGWPNITTNSESNPYSTQGSKTTAFEICSQLKWGTPDWLLVPFGGGGNLYGHYLGFEDFRKLDLITSIPHLVAIQAAGCAPFVRAFKESKAPDEIEEWKNPETIASGIRVPYPHDAELALPALSKSKGTAETVTDQEILEAELRLARTEGIFAEPSAASSIAGLRKLVDYGTVEKNDVVVCEITGTGLKNAMSAALVCGEQATIPPALDEFERILRINPWSGDGRKTAGNHSDTEG